MPSTPDANPFEEVGAAPWGTCRGPPRTATSVAVTCQGPAASSNAPPPQIIHEASAILTPEGLCAGRIALRTTGGTAKRGFVVLHHVESWYRTAGRCTLKGVRATTKVANIRPRNYPARGIPKCRNIKQKGIIPPRSSMNKSPTPVRRHESRGGRKRVQIQHVWRSPHTYHHAR